MGRAGEGNMNSFKQTGNRLHEYKDNDTRSTLLAINPLAPPTYGTLEVHPQHGETLYKKINLSDLQREALARTSCIILVLGLI
eukprot:9023757-Pyramimonas_sp.AAC.1